jgi:hypothetical protein
LSESAVPPPSTIDRSPTRPPRVRNGGGATTHSTTACTPT